MPTFRIVLQAHVAPDAPTRAPRSVGSYNDFRTSIVTAEDIAQAAALAEAQSLLSKATPRPRIVTIEETYPIDPSNITDQELLAALAQHDEALVSEEYAGKPLVERADYPSIINDVAEALRDETLPGLTLSLLGGIEGPIDYVMVEIHDLATSGYRSAGRNPNELIGDESLTGREGVLSIARALVQTVAAEHLL